MDSKNLYHVHHFLCYVKFLNANLHICLENRRRWIQPFCNNKSTFGIIWIPDGSVHSKQELLDHEKRHNPFVSRTNL